MPRSIVVGPEEKAVMRAIARARLSAALDDPAGGLVLAKWKDYQRKVNLKEELVLIPNMKDFKTIATQITDQSPCLIPPAGAFLVIEIFVILQMVVFLSFSQISKYENDDDYLYSLYTNRTCLLKLNL